MKFSHRRRVSSVLRAPVEPRHYLALANMLRLHPQPWREFARYLTGKGSYPYVCRVRTPTGTVSITLYSPDDILTVNEVFCRLDYRAPRDLRVAVDLGSNIGVSALYFLTRNDRARCYLFEPNPTNVERLRRNLRGFEGRYVLHEHAVSDEDGTFDFGIETTGRYGGIGIETGERIRVRARNVNSVLDEVVADEEVIDLLKIDTEGVEVRMLRTVRPDLLARIKLIYFECGRPAEPLHPRLFEQSRRGSRERLVRRSAVAPKA
jgi:FkbM family methyltransferase